MKHLLTITFAIILTLPLQQAHAQEKQNDATWEETIDFIVKYKNYIGETDDEITRIDFGDNRSYIYVYTNWISDNGNTLVGSNKLHFVDLDSVSARQDNEMILYTTGENIKHVGHWKHEAEEIDYRDYMFLYIADDEMRPRLLKAFQHLAYLANKKRAEDRAASGEKF